MNCRTCGAPLPPGAAFCTTCGSSTPYNVELGATPPNSYDPTIAASSSPYNPTVAVPQQPFQQAPSTSYGSPSDPYGAPPQNPYSPPSGYGNYGSQGALNTPSGQGAYGPPQYGYPGQPGPGGYPIGQPLPGQPGQPGPYGTPTPPKRRSRVGLIIGIVVLVLVLACAGIVIAATMAAKNTPSTTSTATTTTTTGTTATAQATTAATSDVPATSAIVPSAAAILSNPKTASAVDQNLLPTTQTSTFTAGQKIYVTFVINSQGKNGYVQVKWYQNGQSLTSDILTHHAENDRGYFSLAYNEAGDGAVAMYWCTQANCADAQLAQVVKFSVTAAALAPSTQTAIALNDVDRRSALLV
jgi:flagellar basal body-associated protein FliL